jgi:hypothetical protein
MRMTCARRGGLSAVLAALLLLGCGGPEPRVASGEAVTTGVMAYDDFFNAVHDLRAEALEAPKDERAPYAKLTQVLGLDPASPASQTVGESGVRAKKLAQERGVQMHLELAPEARLIAAKGKGDPGQDADALVKAMEEAARSSLDMRRRLESLAARAGDLEKRRVDLRAEAPSAFRDASTSKRAEVLAELDAAAAVLEASGDAANRSAGAVSRFVVDLAQAVETGGATAALDAIRSGRGAKRPASAAAAPPPSPPPVAVASAPPKPPPAAKPAAAPGPAPPPPPKKKKPKGGDDFEP